MMTHCAYMERCMKSLMERVNATPVTLRDTLPRAGRNSIH